MEREAMRELLNLILEYYKKLDRGDSLEAFDELIDWDFFKMVNGGLIIDSRDKYQAWYEEANRTLFNRRHNIETLTMKVKGEDLYEARMEMHFTADTGEEGKPEITKTEQRGKILWEVKRPDPALGMKLVRYMIT